MIRLEEFNSGLLEFLRRSPTPFHATAELARLLAARGFQELAEDAPWSLSAGGRYLLRRGGSSLVAFVRGRQSPEAAGLRLIGAHTDSPCLKMKPRPVLRRHGYLQLGVEVYGGALLAPWFDRELSLAGRLAFEGPDGIGQALIDFGAPVGIIPSLAIHLDRSVNDGRAVNAQTQLPVLLGLDAGEPRDIETILLERLREAYPDCGATRVLGHDLCFYDVQPPALVGLHREFIAGARLDNLLSCYAGMQAIAQADAEVDAVLVCNDHEEVGSVSASGASGPLLASVIARMLPDREARERALARSLLVSSDNAHGLHPNFPDKHDANHGPLLNAGPVLKLNANQRYATSGETAAVLRWLADAEGVQLQAFAVRSDMACGSTIGPLTAAAIGVRTVDVGVPTFAMHSPRELAGANDLHALARVMARFLATTRV